MLKRDFARYQKLRKYSHTHLVAVIYNFSGSFATPNGDDVAWLQGSGVLVFNGENPNKVARFNIDFEKFRQGSVRS